MISDSRSRSGEVRFPLRQLVFYILSQYISQVFFLSQVQCKSFSPGRLHLLPFQPFFLRVPFSRINCSPPSTDAPSTAFPRRPNFTLRNTLNDPSNRIPSSLLKSFCLASIDSSPFSVQVRAPAVKRSEPVTTAKDLPRFLPNPLCRVSRGVLWGPRSMSARSVPASGGWTCLLRSALLPLSSKHSRRVRYLPFLFHIPLGVIWFFSRNDNLRIVPGGFANESPRPLPLYHSFAKLSTQRMSR